MKVVPGSSRLSSWDRELFQKAQLVPQHSALHLLQPWLPQSPDGTRRSSFWQLNRKALEAGQGPREKEGRQAVPVSLLCRGDRACSPHAPCLGLQGWGRVPFFP